MGKLDGPIRFTGKLEDLVAYQRRDSDKIIVRMKGGHSRQRLQTAPEFANTRSINSEFGGRSRMSKWIRMILFSLKGIYDYPVASTLTGLMTRVQKLDEEGSWGQRHVLLTRNRPILEGFNLNKKTPFDGLLHTPLKFELAKATLSARIELPQLVPGLNFQSRRDLPMYQVTLILGIVPDLFFDPQGYTADKGYNYFQFKEWNSTWHATSKGSEAETVELKLEEQLPNDHYSLMLAIGIKYGKMATPQKVEEVKYVGAGKILAMA
jgi:hypothetical protein